MGSQSSKNVDTEEPVVDVVQFLDGHRTPVTCVEILPDGRVLSGDEEGSILMWCTYFATCVVRYIGHEDGVTCITPYRIKSTDLLGSSSWDGTVKLWNMSSGACLRTYRFEHAVLAVLSVSFDHRAKVDSPGYTTPARSPSHEVDLVVAVESVSELYVVPSLPDSEERVAVVDISASWAQESGDAWQYGRDRRWRGEGVWSPLKLLALPAGRIVLGCSWAAALYVFDVPGRRYDRPLMGHDKGERIQSLAAVHVPPLFASAGGGKLFLWDAVSLSSLRSFSLGFAVERMKPLEESVLIVIGNGQCFLIDASRPNHSGHRVATEGVKDCILLHGGSQAVLCETAKSSVSVFTLPYRRLTPLSPASLSPASISPTNRPGGQHYTSTNFSAPSRTFFHPPRSSGDSFNLPATKVPLHSQGGGSATTKVQCGRAVASEGLGRERTDAPHPTSRRAREGKWVASRPSEVDAPVDRFRSASLEPSVYGAQGGVRLSFEECDDSDVELDTDDGVYDDHDHSGMYERHSGGDMNLNGPTPAWLGRQQSEARSPTPIYLDGTPESDSVLPTDAGSSPSGSIHLPSAATGPYVAGGATRSGSAAGDTTRVLASYAASAGDPSFSGEVALTVSDVGGISARDPPPPYSGSGGYVSVRSASGFGGAMARTANVELAGQNPSQMLCNLPFESFAPNAILSAPLQHIPQQHPACEFPGDGDVGAISPSTAVSTPSASVAASNESSPVTVHEEGRIAPVPGRKAGKLAEHIVHHASVAALYALSPTCFMSASETGELILWKERWVEDIATDSLASLYTYSRHAAAAEYFTEYSPFDDVPTEVDSASVSTAADSAHIEDPSDRCSELGAAAGDPSFTAGSGGLSAVLQDVQVVIRDGISDVHEAIRSSINNVHVAIRGSNGDQSSGCEWIKRAGEEERSSILGTDRLSHSAINSPSSCALDPPTKGVLFLGSSPRPNDRRDLQCQEPAPGAAAVVCPTGDTRLPNVVAPGSPTQNPVVENAVVWNLETERLVDSRQHLLDAEALPGGSSAPGGIASGESDYEDCRPDFDSSRVFRRNDSETSLHSLSGERFGTPWSSFSSTQASPNVMRTGRRGKDDDDLPQTGGPKCTGENATFVCSVSTDRNPIYTAPLLADRASHNETECCPSRSTGLSNTATPPKPQTPAPASTSPVKSYTTSIRSGYDSAPLPSNHVPPLPPPSHLSPSLPAEIPSPTSTVYRPRRIPEYLMDRARALLLDEKIGVAEVYRRLVESGNAETLVCRVIDSICGPGVCGRKS